MMTTKDQGKNVKVDEATWLALQHLKLDMGFKTVGEVVKILIEKKVDEALKNEYARQKQGTEKDNSSTDI